MTRRKVQWVKEVMRIYAVSHFDYDHNVEELWMFVLFVVFFFFFKQKTSYEFRLSIVGSERWIRDRCE